MMLNSLTNELDSLSEGESVASSSFELMLGPWLAACGRATCQLQGCPVTGADQRQTTVIRKIYLNYHRLYAKTVFEKDRMMLRMRASAISRHFDAAGCRSQADSQDAYY